MNIRIYELQDAGVGNCLGIIDNYKSFNFTNSFQECGGWQLRGVLTPQAADLLRPGRMIYVNEQISGIIESFVVDTTEKGNQFYTAYGKELKAILGYRIAWDTYNHSLPINKYIQGLLEENTRGERTLGLGYNEIKPDKSIELPTVNKQYSYKNLLEIMKDITEGSSTINTPIGFDVRAKADENMRLHLVFDFLVGLDYSYASNNPMVFSKDFNNLKTSTLTQSKRDTKNVILGAGEGEGAARKRVVVKDGNPQGLNRKEVYKDLKSIQSKYKDKDGKEQTMGEKEYMELLTHKAQESLTDDVLTLNGSSVIYGNPPTYLLGGKVQLIDKDFQVSTSDVIMEVNFVEEADGMETTLTIGKDIQAQRYLIKEQ